jgi:predicted O-linked N-acetylglucosamine transferase (SPINDLY family)
MNLQPLCDRAGQFLQSGNLTEAERLYAEVLAVEPMNFTATLQLGIIRAQRGEYAEASKLIGSALKAQPYAFAALVSHGDVLSALGRPDLALASYTRALAIKPDDVTAQFNRANALYSSRRFTEALAGYDRVLGMDQNLGEAWCNRGNALLHLNRFDEALVSYDKALMVKPDFAMALYNRGTIQWTQYRRYDAAIGDLENVIRINPDYDYARGDLLHLRMHGADWLEFEREKALVDAGVRAGKRIATPFMYQAVSQSPADLQVCSRTYAKHQFPSAPALWKKSDRAHAKIRIGYVSGEFRNQATAHLTAGLYESHDKRKFEIVAFDNGRNDDSPIRKRLEVAFDRFVDISGLSDRAAAKKILGEEIDILVNLNGYFGKQRTGIFSQRPAPIQVNYLGFPGTLGASYIDYILADRFVIPPEERQYYTENVVYLPDSYQANDRTRPATQPILNRVQNGLPDEAFVFCNFNNGYKLTPAMFSVWMRILRQVDRSVLWLLESNATFARNIKRESERHGVDGHRIIFAPRVPMEEHCARLKLADLFLDSLPYNAHTTASDALWVGLPLVTCYGSAFPGRVATSLLRAIGLPELVSENFEGYETCALNLARDPTSLQSIREKLARNRLNAPLFDTDRFRRHVESAYATMWEIFQRGETPRSFRVAVEEGLGQSVGAT